MQSARSKDDNIVKNLGGRRTASYEVKSRFKPWFKSIAIILACLFLFNDIAQAAPNPIKISDPNKTSSQKMIRWLAADGDAGVGNARNVRGVVSSTLACKTLDGIFAYGFPWPLKDVAGALPQIIPNERGLYEIRRGEEIWVPAIGKAGAIEGYVRYYDPKNAEALAGATETRQIGHVRKEFVPVAGAVDRQPDAAETIASVLSEHGIDDAPRAAKATLTFIQNMQKEGNNDRVVFRPEPSKDRTRVRNVLLHQGDSGGLIVLKAQDINDIVHGHLVGSDLKIHELIDHRVLKTDGGQEARELINDVKRFLTTFTRNKFLGLLKDITGLDSLEWEDIGKDIYIEGYMAGSNKHVFKIKLYGKNDEELAFAVATKIERAVRSIPGTEVKELERLQKRPSKVVPRFGDSRRFKGERWYVEEFIEGDQVETLRKQEKLTIGIRKRIVSTLLSIAVGLKGLVPRDIHAENFIVSKNDGQVVMVDIGTSRFNILGKEENEIQRNTKAEHRIKFLAVLIAQYGFLRGTPEENHFLFDAIVEDRNISDGEGMEWIRQVHRGISAKTPRELAEDFSDFKWVNHFRNVFINAGIGNYPNREDAIKALTPFSELFKQSISSYLAKVEERGGPSSAGAEHEKYSAKEGGAGAVSRHEDRRRKQKTIKDRPFVRVALKLFTIGVGIAIFFIWILPIIRGPKIIGPTTTAPPKIEAPAKKPSQKRILPNAIINREFRALPSFNTIGNKIAQLFGIAPQLIDESKDAREVTISKLSKVIRKNTQDSYFRRLNRIHAEGGKQKLPEDRKGALGDELERAAYVAFAESLKEFNVPYELAVAILFNESNLNIDEDRYNPLHLTGDTINVLRNNLRVLLSRNKIKSAFIRKTLGEANKYGKGKAYHRSMDARPLLQAKANIIYAIFYLGNIYNQPKDGQRLGSVPDRMPEWNNLSEEEKLLRIAAIYNAGLERFIASRNKSVSEKGTTNLTLGVDILPHIERSLGYSVEAGKEAKVGRSITRAYIYKVRQSIYMLNLIAGEAPKVRCIWKEDGVTKPLRQGKAGAVGEEVQSVKRKAQSESAGSYRLFKADKLFPAHFNIFKYFAQKPPSNILTFMDWYNGSTAIWMSHIDMTTALTYFFKTKAFEDADYMDSLERPYAGHIVTSWIPMNLAGVIFSFWTSRQRFIAFLTRLIKISSDFAWVWQPRKAGTVAKSTLSSSFSIITRNSIFLCLTFISNLHMLLPTLSKTNIPQYPFEVKQPPRIVEGSPAGAVLLRPMGQVDRGSGFGGQVDGAPRLRLLSVSLGTPFGRWTPSLRSVAGAVEGAAGAVEEKDGASRRERFYETQRRLIEILSGEFQRKFAQLISGTIEEQELLAYYDSVAQRLFEVLNLDKAKFMRIFENLVKPPRDISFFDFIGKRIDELNTLLMAHGVILKEASYLRPDLRSIYVTLRIGIVDVEHVLRYQYSGKEFKIVNIKEWVGTDPDLTFNEVVSPENQIILINEPCIRNDVNVGEDHYRDLIQGSGQYYYEDENFTDKVLRAMHGDDSYGFIYRGTLFHELKHAQDFVFLTGLGIRTVKDFKKQFAEYALRKDGVLYSLYQNLAAAPLREFLSIELSELSANMARVYNSPDPRRSVANEFWGVNSKLRRHEIFVKLLGKELNNKTVSIDLETPSPREINFGELNDLFDEVMGMDPAELKNLIKAIYIREFKTPFSDLEIPTSVGPLEAGAVEATAEDAFLNESKGIIDIYTQLLIMLKYGSDEDRIAAAKALIGTEPQAIEILVELLNKGREPYVRISAATALIGTREEPQAINTLLGLLKDEDNIYWTARIAAAKALIGTREEPQAITAIVELLKDGAASVRVAAARALIGTKKDLRAINTLVGLLKDGAASVRVAAATALIGTREELQAIDTLVELLKYMDLSVRIDAAIALKSTGEESQAIDTLLVLLFKVTYLPARISAATALIGTREELQAINTLVELLKEGNTYVRTAVARALIGTRDPSAIKALVGLLKDEDGRVRIAAANSIDYFLKRDPSARIVNRLDSDYEQALPEIKNTFIGFNQGLKDERKIDVESFLDENRYQLAWLYQLCVREKIDLESLLNKILTKAGFIGLYRFLKLTQNLASPSMFKELVNIYSKDISPEEYAPVTNLDEAKVVCWLGRSAVIPINHEEAQVIKYQKPSEDKKDLEHETRMMVELKRLASPEAILQSDGTYLFQDESKVAPPLKINNRRWAFSYICDMDYLDYTNEPLVWLPYKDRVERIKGSFIRIAKRLAYLHNNRYGHDSLLALYHKPTKRFDSERSDVGDIRGLINGLKFPNFRISGDLADYQHITLNNTIIQNLFELNLGLGHSGIVNNLKDDDIADMVMEVLREYVYARVGGRYERFLSPKNMYLYFISRLKYGLSQDRMTPDDFGLLLDAVKRMSKEIEEEKLLLDKRYKPSSRAVAGAVVSTAGAVKDLRALLAVDPSIKVEDLRWKGGCNRSSAETIKRFYEGFDDEGRSEYALISLVEKWNTSAPLFLEDITSMGSNLNILSIGFGLGRLEKQIKETGQKVVGIDLSPENFEKARRINNFTNTATADAHNLPFGNREFDVVMFSESIEEIDIILALKEAYRVLKPDGKLLLTTYYDDATGYATYRGYSLKEIRAALDMTGFLLEKYTPREGDSGDKRDKILYMKCGKKKEVEHPELIKDTEIGVDGIIPIFTDEMDSGEARTKANIRSVLGIQYNPSVTEEAADFELGSKLHVDSAARLNMLRESIKKTLGIKRDPRIKIFFSTTYGDTNYFWYGDKYAPCYVDKKSKHIYLSAPFVNSTGTNAFINVVAHALRYLEGKAAVPVNDSLTWVMDKLAETDVIIKKENERFEHTVWPGLKEALKKDLAVFGIPEDSEVRAEFATGNGYKAIIRKKDDGSDKGEIVLFNVRNRTPQQLLNATRHIMASTYYDNLDDRLAGIENDKDFRTLLEAVGERYSEVWESTHDNGKYPFAVGRDNKQKGLEHYTSPGKIYSTAMVYAMSPRDYRGDETDAYEFAEAYDGVDRETISRFVTKYGPSGLKLSRFSAGAVTDVYREPFTVNRADLSNTVHGTRYTVHGEEAGAVDGAGAVEDYFVTSSMFLRNARKILKFFSTFNPKSPLAMLCGGRSWQTTSTFLIPDPNSSILGIVTTAAYSVPLAVIISIFLFDLVGSQPMAMATSIGMVERVAPVSNTIFKGIFLPETPVNLTSTNKMRVLGLRGYLAILENSYHTLREVVFRIVNQYRQFTFYLHQLFIDFISVWTMGEESASLTGSGGWVGFGHSNQQPFVMETLAYCFNRLGFHLPFTVSNFNTFLSNRQVSVTGQYLSNVVHGTRQEAGAVTGVYRGPFTVNRADLSNTVHGKEAGAVDGAGAVENLASRFFSFLFSGNIVGQKGNLPIGIGESYVEIGKNVLPTKEIETNTKAWRKAYSSFKAYISYIYENLMQIYRDKATVSYHRERSLAFDIIEPDSSSIDDGKEGYRGAGINIGLRFMSIKRKFNNWARILFVYLIGEYNQFPHLIRMKRSIEEKSLGRGTGIPVGFPYLLVISFSFLTISSLALTGNILPSATKIYGYLPLYLSTIILKCLLIQASLFIFLDFLSAILTASYVSTPNIAYYLYKVNTGADEGSNGAVDGAGAVSKVDSGQFTVDSRNADAGSTLYTVNSKLSNAGAVAVEISESLTELRFEVDFAGIDEGHRPLVEAILGNRRFIINSIQNIYPEMSSQEISVIRPKYHLSQGDKTIFELPITFKNDGTRTVLLIITESDIFMGKPADSLARLYESIIKRDRDHEFVHRWGDEADIIYTTELKKGLTMQNNRHVFSIEFHSGVTLDEVVTVLESLVGIPGYPYPEGTEKSLTKIEPEKLEAKLNKLVNYRLLSPDEKEKILISKKRDDRDALKVYEERLKKLIFELDKAAVKTQFRFSQKTSYIQHDPRRNNIVFRIDANGKWVFKPIDYGSMVQNDSLKEMISAFDIFENKIRPGWINVTVRPWAWTYLMDKTSFFETFLEVYGKQEGRRLLTEVMQEFQSSPWEYERRSQVLFHIRKFLARTRDVVPPQFESMPGSVPQKPAGAVESGAGAMEGVKELKSVLGPISKNTKAGFQKIIDTNSSEKLWKFFNSIIPFEIGKRERWNDGTDRFQHMQSMALVLDRIKKGDRSVFNKAKINPELIFDKGRKLFQEADNIFTLFSLFFVLHDIGRLVRGNHYRVGLEVSEDLLVDLGYDGKESRFIAALIYHHADIFNLYYKAANTSETRQITKSLILTKEALHLSNEEFLRFLRMIAFFTVFDIFYSPDRELTDDNIPVDGDRFHNVNISEILSMPNKIINGTGAVQAPGVAEAVDGAGAVDEVADSVERIADEKEPHVGAVKQIVEPKAQEVLISEATAISAEAVTRGETEPRSAVEFVIHLIPLLKSIEEGGQVGIVMEKFWKEDPIGKAVQTEGRVGLQRLRTHIFGNGFTSEVMEVLEMLGYDKRRVQILLEDPEDVASTVERLAAKGEYKKVLTIARGSIIESLSELRVDENKDRLFFAKLNLDNFMNAIESLGDKRLLLCTVDILAAGVKFMNQGDTFGAYTNKNVSVQIVNGMPVITPLARPMDIESLDEIYEGLILAMTRA